MNTNIFRKKSLEQLASPERLDELMQITSPRLWIALLSIGALLAFSLVWGVCGSIATKVQGTGIILKNGGLFLVSSLGAGQVRAIQAKVGDVVAAGQIVATLDLPQMAQQLDNARKDFAYLKEDTEQRLAADQKETTLNIEALDRQKANLQQLVANLEDQASWLQQQTGNQDKLLAEGLITRQTLVATTQQLNGVKVRIADTRSQMNDLALRQLQLENDRRDRASQAEFRLSQSGRSLAALEDNYRRSADIVAPYRGRVIEIMARPSDLVQPGSPLINLELVGEKLTALVYVAARDGKQVKPGMKIQISPSTVKKERFGVMLGRVVSVSEFPSTTAAMAAILKNDALITMLSSQGAQFAVQADLIPDPATESGYAWSSSKGPPVTINAGTLCDSNVIVEEQAPITMVMPFLRKQLGL